jgi:hypothetical protein
MTSAAVDQIYGELFTFFAFRQVADVNKPREADPTRLQFTAKAAFIGTTKAIYPDARGIEASNAQRVSVSVPWLSIDNANLAWPVIAGDRARREKTGDIYEIAKPMPDGVKRTVLPLTAKKAS